jgi:Glycosyl transferase family 2
MLPSDLYTFTPLHPQRAQWPPENPTGQAPRLSIITTCYNSAAYFPDTAKAVLRSTFPYWEWIIVDDGSTDPAMAEQLAAFAALDGRMRVFSPGKMGRGKAVNHAVEQATTPFLFFLDSDDLVEPTCFEKALWCLETHPQYAACGNWFTVFGKEHYVWPKGFSEGRLNLTENQNAMTCLLRREAFLSFGGLNVALPYHEDWEMWLALADRGQWGFTIAELAWWYRRRQDSRSEQRKTNSGYIEFLRAHLRGKFPRLYEDPAVFPKPDPTVSAPPGPALTNLPALPTAQASNAALLVISPSASAKAIDETLANLSQRRITILAPKLTTFEDLARWMPHSPDVFCPHAFLAPANYHAFVAYLLHTRAINDVYWVAGETLITWSASPDDLWAAATITHAIEANALAAKAAKLAEVQQQLADREESVAWLESQVQNWRTEAENIKIAAEEKMAWLESQMQHWRAEAESSRVTTAEKIIWLEGQIQSWQAETERQKHIVEEREAYIANRQEAIIWLEGQLKTWQAEAEGQKRIAEEREAYIINRQEAITWLEGQLKIWQAEAERRKKR